MMKPPPSSGSLLVILACFAALAACDVLTSPETRLARAGDALEEGNLEAAVADARAVAEKHADNAQAWLLLARVGLKYGDTAGALRDLDLASKAGASVSEIRPIRDQALLQSGQIEELLAQSAQDAEQMMVQATALASLGRIDEASKLIRQALESDSQLVSARLLDLRLLYMQGRPTEARQALAGLLRDHPEASRAWLQQASFALADGDASGALEAFTKAELRARQQLSVPEQAALLAALTEAQLSAGQIDAASSTLTKLQQLAPKAAVTEFLSARISLAQGDAATAVATLQNSLVNNPGHVQSRVLLSMALLDQDLVEQARNQLNSLVAEQPENMDARRLLARLHLSQGDMVAAERILTELPEDVQADPASDWMRSAILSMTGNRAESLMVLEQAAKGDPLNIPLQLDLVRAYLASGRRDDATLVLNRIPEQKSGWPGKQLLVLSTVIGQPKDQVRRRLAALAASHPGDAQLQTVIGQFLVQTGDVPAAEEQFRVALGHSAKLAEARMGLASVALTKGELDAARRELRQVIADAPLTEQAYLGLAAIAIRQKNDHDARQWLEQAISAVPATVTARLALAELLYRDTQSASAEALLEQAVAVSRDKPTAMLGVGDVQLRASQPAKAIASFERAYAMRPSSALAMKLFVARRAIDQPGADAILRQWLQRQPADVPVRAALANHLLQQDSLREAIVEYERLVKTTPAPVLLNNLAWAYQKVGDGRAEATAKRAYDAAPGNPFIADTYGWILLETGRAVEALPLLKKAAEGLPDNADVQANYSRAREATER